MIKKAVLKTHIARKNLLLPELLIVLFFFSLAAAGCVKLFGMAYEDVNYSRELSAAVIEAQNAAEYFKATGETFPELNCKGDINVAVTVTEAEGLDYAQIIVTNRKGEEIYSLLVARVKGVPS